jgi:hypothetical protein
MRAMLLASGWWTANHDLVIFNALLAAAAVGTMTVGLLTIRSSNRVAASAAEQVNQGLNQLELGKEQLAKEREALQATFRPIVVEVPVDFLPTQRREAGEPPDRGAVFWHETNEADVFSVPFRNVGSGPAFIHQAILTTGPGNVFEAQTAYRVIPTGEIALVAFSVAAGDPGFPVAKTAFVAGKFLAALQCSDIAGGQRTQTVLHLMRFPSGKFEVIGLQLYHCDENWIRANEPFIKSGRDAMSLPNIVPEN